MSFIPPKCPQCGEPLKRISDKNPNVTCIECERVFELLEITMNKINSYQIGSDSPLIQEAI